MMIIENPKAIMSTKGGRFRIQGIYYGPNRPNGLVNGAEILTSYVVSFERVRGKTVVTTFTGSRYQLRRTN